METRPREVNLVHLLLIVWNGHKRILAGTAIIGLVGLLYAIFATPVYYSQATISLKEREQESSASQFLSQLGGRSLAGNSLSKIEIILKSQELAEGVVRSNNLLPELFPKAWDSAAGTWKAKLPPRKIPTVRKGGSKLRGRHLEVVVDPKKGVIEIGINSDDPYLSRDLVKYYLAALNERIRRDVTRAADTERKYLEDQMVYATDPVLREKIHGMIVFQIEKSMLVSAEAFETLEGPLLPLQPVAPQRLRIVVIATFLGVVISTFAVMGWQALLVLWAALKREKSGHASTGRK